MFYKPWHPSVLTYKELDNIMYGVPLSEFAFYKKKEQKNNVHIIDYICDIILYPCNLNPRHCTFFALVGMEPLKAHTHEGIKYAIRHCSRWNFFIQKVVVIYIFALKNESKHSITLSLLITSDWMSSYVFDEKHTQNFTLFSEVFVVTKWR